MESARLTQLIFHVENAGKRYLPPGFIDLSSSRASSSSIFLSHESLIERLSSLECLSVEITYGGTEGEYWSNSIRVIHREMKRVQVRCTRVVGEDTNLVRGTPSTRYRNIFFYISNVTFRIFYSRVMISRMDHRSRYAQVFHFRKKLIIEKIRIRINILKFFRRSFSKVLISLSIGC